MAATDGLFDCLCRSVQAMAHADSGKHSTLQRTQEHLNGLLAAGMPAKELTLGLLPYGSDVATGTPMTYAEIVAKYRPNPDRNQVGQMYFNGPKTIRRKIAFSIESKFGGVMDWELGQDARGKDSLLHAIERAIYDATKQRSK